MRRDIRGVWDREGRGWRDANTKWTALFKADRPNVQHMRVAQKRSRIPKIAYFKEPMRNRHILTDHPRSESTAITAAEHRRRFRHFVQKSLR